MEDNSFLKKLFASLFLFLGLLIGVLLVPALNNRGIGYGSAAVGLIIIVISIILIRIYVIRQRKMLKSPGAGAKDSEVEFVVDTFQDLVGKLVEKEKELERLKAFAEEKATSIEAYNENLLQSVPSGVISVENDMKIKSINQAAERILSIISMEVMGKHFNEVLTEPFITLIKKHETVSRGEYPCVTTDGRHIWLGITSSQLKNSEGAEIGFILVFTDLTDIKALQSQVELKERLSRLGEMSAGISHELRNGMGVIAGYVKLLRKKVDASNLATVDAILTEIGSMDRIISELLAFAKPSVLHTEQVNLNELIEKTLSSIVGEKSNVSVSVHAEEPVSVKIDEVLMRQAISNLFINALEAMPDGGSLEVTIHLCRHKAEVSIKDTGCGIPQNIIQKIFLPFYTTKEKGIGFGLALVQKIIVSHGGSIQVESEEGSGTVFRMILPAAD